MHGVACGDVVSGKEGGGGRPVWLTHSDAQIRCNVGQTASRALPVVFDKTNSMHWAVSGGMYRD